MNKTKVGDKVRLVNKPIWVGAYEDGDTGVVVDKDSHGNACTREDHVLVLLDKGSNQIFTVHENQIQVVNSAGVFTSLKPSAEQIRENILSLRIERERLNVAISDVDKKETEMKELLKEIGFVLHEEVVKSSDKTVLYAEDIEEDMSNYLNWKYGDILEVMMNGDHKVPYGAIVKHADKDGEGCPYTDSKYAANWSINDKFLRFHSRPVNN